MKDIWKSYVTVNAFGEYIAKKAFQAYRLKADDTFSDFSGIMEEGTQVPRFFVENENFTNDEGELVIMEYTPTDREIVMTRSQGVKYKDQVDWDVEEARLLADAKSQKKAELTQERDKIETKVVTLDKFKEQGNFEFDELSQVRLRNAKDALADGESRYWTLDSKEIVSVLKSDFEEIFTIASQRSDAAFAKLISLKAEVDACTTIEDVEKIVWDDDAI